ncbi:MAG: hypothetical protein WBE93_22070 [Pseudolabrys sp.]|jgi:hypothetical protein
MRTTLNLILIVLGVLTSVMVPSNETVAIAKAKGYPHNLAVVHVARPDGMKTFPVEVVPQP